MHAYDCTSTDRLSYSRYMVFITRMYNASKRKESRLKIFSSAFGFSLFFFYCFVQFYDYGWHEPFVLIRIKFVIWYEYLQHKLFSNVMYSQIRRTPRTLYSSCTRIHRVLYALSPLVLISRKLSVSFAMYARDYKRRDRRPQSPSASIGLRIRCILRLAGFVLCTSIDTRAAVINNRFVCNFIIRLF